VPPASAKISFNRFCDGTANGVCAASTNTRLLPSETMKSPSLPICRWVFGCVRIR